MREQTLPIPDLNAIMDEFIDRIVERVAARMETAQTLRPRLLTVEQAAQYLGRTPSAVRCLINKDAFKAVKADGRVMLDIQDLNRWITQNKTE